MKKSRPEEDEEIRRAKANIRIGFIIAVVALVLFAIIAAVMLLFAGSTLYSILNFPDMGTSVIPSILKLKPFI